MTLLYLSLAYLSGIVLGQLFWNTGWIGCDFPDRLWLLPLSLLPLTPLLKHLHFFTPQPLPTMRWPASAGFEPPRVGPSPTLVAAIALSIVTGICRYASQPVTPCLTPADLAYYNLSAARAFDRAASQVTVSGYVSSYPLVKDTKQRMQVTAQHIMVDGTEHNVQGVLQLSTNIRQRYRYGQPVRVQGRLVTPPDFEDFSYREYLARKGIHSLLYNARIDQVEGTNAGNLLTQALYALRSRGEVLLNRLLPEPYAALTNGMLLGIEAGIPDDLYEQFNRTGTSHTIVISGSNVAVISSLFMAMGLRLWGRKRAVWFAVFGIGCYALLVGGDAAVLRAAFMGGLYVIATALDRRSTALVSLSVACWVMTLINPLTLWDVGFQLSSAATAGLILFAPGIIAYFSRLWPRFDGGSVTAPETVGIMGKAVGVVQGLMQDGLLTTIAANVTTLPLVVYYFGRISAVSLLTNVAIAPVQPYIMLWGSVGILIGVVGLPWLAWLILLVPWLSLVWTVTMVRWTATLPGASLEIRGYNGWGLLLTYVMIAGFYWRSLIRNWFQAKIQAGLGEWQSYLVGPSAAGVLGVGCILLWTGALSQPDGRLHVHFLDVGQGDGIFIQTPAGRQVLIDGGASPQQLFSQLGEVMPFWDRSLDLVVLTNPDKDHMEAQTQVPTRFQVTTAIETTTSQANPDADLWRMNMANAGVDLQVQQRGGWIDLGDGVALWALWPPPTPLGMDNANEQFVDNENSLILKLVYGEFSVLLTGDAGLPAEAELLAAQAPLMATVLKVGHHGSKGSTGSAFVQAVNPAVAVIQSGVDNDYGHPHQEALDRLAGRLILRNDQQGRIHIYSDGQQMWIESATNPPAFN